MSLPKYATVVGGVIDVISYYPDRDVDGNVLAPWVLVADDVFGGFIDNGDGTFSAPVLPPPPPPPPYTLSVTLLWMRMTDLEAEEFDAEMSVASPLRLRKAFGKAQTLTEDSELFIFVHGVLTATFTETKADELLLPQQPGEEYVASAGEPVS